MKALLILLLVAFAVSAAAQQQPFDMSPERPRVEEPEPLPQQPEPAPEPETEPEPLEPPVEAVPAPAEPEPVQPSPEPVPEAAEQNIDIRRQLLSDGNLMLAGETASRSWIVHLTEAQASAPAELHLGYRNAVVVAPESSRLQLLLNNVVVVDQAVRSTDDFSYLQLDVPDDLLREGRNEMSIRVRQRHRTDCTVLSTYELWTEVDASGTFLSFGDAAARNFATMNDLRALAPDAEGKIRIEFVAPAMERSDLTAELMLLAQAIALHANQTNLDFAIAGAPGLETAEPALRVLVGTVDDLIPVSDGLALGDAQGPIVRFLEDERLDVPTLLIAGRSRDDWATAIGQLLAPVDRAVPGRRDALVTESWSVPNAPMVYDSRSLSFAQLGIQSQQFSGRRYLRSFTLAIPPDFYAASYGQARLLLDAAFTAAVLPGSSINVYVNGNIAATMPLIERNGAVLDGLPIEVTMRHLQPGLNEVSVEAQLLTQQDEACLPGASSDDTPRFAIFDTSQFVVPDYGRIAQYPNLAATSGTGYPYGLAEEPVALIVDHENEADLSAAANIFARMALSAGRAIPVSATSSPDAARDNHAVFIGAINSLPAGVLGQVGVDEASRSAWTGLTEAPTGGQPVDETSLDDWRRDTNSFGLGDIEDWFSRTFGITFDMLRFRPRDDAAFQPSQADALLVAQGVNPAGTGVWTVITAPGENELSAGASALADHRLWGRLSGHLATIETDMQTVVSRSVTRSRLVESQPAGFTNYRLIATNWLSANILSYSLLLVLGCLILGIGTSALLSRLGRRK